MLDDQDTGVVAVLSKTGPDDRCSRNAAKLDGAVQAHLGDHLRTLYGDPTAKKVPKDLRQLGEHLIQVIRVHTVPHDQAFIDGIMGSLPALRAFALSLTRDGVRAEDLIQSTVLKAISRQQLFARGTNLQAWLFTVMRNGHYTELRSRRREIEDIDGGFAETLTSLPEQDGKLLGDEIKAALTRLSSEQRTVLLLVGVQGMAYEDAARALGCTLGTIKSRLNRARNRLAELLKLDQDDVGGGRTYGH